MEFRDFEEQIFSTDQAIHREISKDAVATHPWQQKDLNDLRAAVRRAAQDMILCADMNEAISRLRENSEAQSTLISLTIEAPLSRDDHRVAARRAFEATPHERGPSTLPLYPYCSYLLQLCSALEVAKH